MSQRRNVPSEGDRRLFQTGGQQELFGERALEEDQEPLDLGEAKRTADGAAGRKPIECLGKTFDNDDERRSYFTQRLREKLQDSSFREQPGFPIGSDEDIMRMSDPPYYTACPNPFLGDFVRIYGTPYNSAVPYQVEPFAVDVTEGKGDPVYKAHGYHTKVPHLAIVPPILNYTEPGDLVLDGFAGSGMTGLAAQWCGAAPEAYRRRINAQFEADDRPAPRWGSRRAIMNDLSPAATLIAANYNLPFEADAFERHAGYLLREIEAELGWMYETKHTDGNVGHIEYMIWSEVFACPECSKEVNFFRAAFDSATTGVRDEFPCPHCTTKLTKRRLIQLLQTQLDPALDKTIRVPRREPVLIRYSVGSRTYQKEPDEFDLAVLTRAARLQIPRTVPHNRMMNAPDDQDCWGDKWRAGTASFSHVHHLFLPRTTQTIGRLWERAIGEPDKRLRNLLLFWLDSHLANLSIQNRYRPEVSFPYNPLSGVYYVSSLISEANPFVAYRNKLKRITAAFTAVQFRYNNSIISTGDCAGLWGVPDESVDYVFTDPPFGENLAYSELNFVVEAWHRVFTDQRLEAIESKTQRKMLREYGDLMQACFREYHRTLKPNHWMTVVFHNSRNSVWNAIQEAIISSGFVIADVRMLDKQQGSFNQVVASGSMKQDLVVSAYKPATGLENRFNGLGSSTAQDAWAFIHGHLRQLPVFVRATDNRAEIIAERRAYMLYDRTVAYFVQRGVSVPLSAADFYMGLSQRLPERDGMYFLPDQVVEYDQRRLSVRELLQLQFIVTDEASAIHWVRQELERKPQTAQELTPKFLKEMGAWSKHEERHELSKILQGTFLRQPPASPIARQIVAWMKKSSELRETIRALEAESDDPQGDLRTSDTRIIAAAKDRWYVPDASRIQDLEKLRERELLQDFERYKSFTGRQLKVFRLEALRAGFKKAWTEHDYVTILSVAAKIPEDVLQEDQKLLMWYDQAQTRAGA